MQRNFNPETIRYRKVFAVPNIGTRRKKKCDLSKGRPRLTATERKLTIIKKKSKKSPR